jgi:hypothetical protein
MRDSFFLIYLHAACVRIQKVRSLAKCMTHFFPLIHLNARPDLASPICAVAMSNEHMLILDSCKYIYICVCFFLVSPE